MITYIAFLVIEWLQTASISLLATFFTLLRGFVLQQNCKGLNQISIRRYLMANIGTTTYLEFCWVAKPEGSGQILPRLANRYESNCD